MAKMTVGPGGIEILQGALARPTKKDGHKHGRYFVATHRTAATTNPECQRVYSWDKDRYKRSTVPSAREMENRIRFTAVRQAVYNRAHDLTKISADQQAFLAQKNEAGGIRSMKAWYWKQEGDAYDAQHQG